MPSPLKIAVLLSGSGRTLQNFIDLRRAGELNIEIPLVIGSKPDLLGLQRAAEAGIKSQVAQRRDFSSLTDYGDKIFTLCDQADINLVCLAGWLCLLDLPDRYRSRAMNIHPALLPAFGGKGMFGHHVHESVINHGCKVSGCTVHFIDNAYDTGPIIIQRTCPVQDNDTADTLAARVFEQEKLAYPEAIDLFAQNRLHIKGRRVSILPENKK